MRKFENIHIGIIVENHAKLENRYFGGIKRIQRKPSQVLILRHYRTLYYPQQKCHRRARRSKKIIQQLVHLARKDIVSKAARSGSSKKEILTMEKTWTRRTDIPEGSLYPGRAY